MATQPSNNIINFSVLKQDALKNEAKVIYNMLKGSNNLSEGTFSGKSIDGTDISYTITGKSISLTYTTTGNTVSYTDPYAGTSTIDLEYPDPSIIKPF